MFCLHNVDAAAFLHVKPVIGVSEAACFNLVRHVCPAFHQAGPAEPGLSYVNDFGFQRPEDFSDLATGSRISAQGLQARSDCAVLMASAVIGFPPIAHSPLAISCTRTQVTPRMASPSTPIMASVTSRIILCFWSSSKTPSISSISTRGIAFLLSYPSLLVLPVPTGMSAKCQSAPRSRQFTN